jgi:recombinational DNA repair protein RecR
VIFCKGVCEHLGTTNFKTYHIQKYKNGFKYCSICTTWFENYKRCPCCNNKLRTKPRHSVSKRKFLVQTI